MGALNASQAKTTNAVGACIEIGVRPRGESILLQPASACTSRRAASRASSGVAA